MAGVTAGEELAAGAVAGAARPLWQHITWPECRGWRDAGNRLHRCEQGDVPHHRSGRCRDCNRRHDEAQEARSAARERRKEAHAPVAAQPVHPDEFGGEDTPHAPAAETLATLLRYAGMPVPEQGEGGAILYTHTFIPETPPLPASVPDLVRAGTAVGTAVAATVAAPPAPPAPPAAASEGEEFAWTLFEGVARTNDALAPVISLGKDGDCRLNVGALALWPGEVAAVEVLFDRAKRALALRPCAVGAAAGRRLRLDRKTGAKVCSLRAFRAAHDWLPAETLRLTPRLVGGLLVIVVGETAAR